MRIIFFTVLLHICTIIYSQLSSSFTSNKSVGCGSTAIQFDGNASTGYDRFAWDFGNGQSNTNSLKPIVLFEPGSYEVTLNVYKGTSSKSSSMKIEVYNAPYGFIEFIGKNKGCRNDNFKFKATITDGDTSKMTVNWIYGDGYKGSGKTMSHTYEFTNPYGFPLVMELIDENNCSYKTYQYISISDKPQIEFNNNQSLFCDSLNVPLSITPNALVSVDSIIWQLDGEKVYDTLNFVHKFKDYGKKLVKVTIVDDNGCSNTATDTVEILDIKAKIGIADSVCVGQWAEFTQDSSGADRYTWYFEDGSTSNQKSPSKKMNDADSSYMVILEASNDECTAYDTISFSVSSAIASFEMDTSWFCDFPGDVKFTNTSTGNSKKVIWRYNKNQTSSQDSPSLSINQTGYIHLNVTGDNNCITKDSAYFGQKRPKPVITLDIDHGCIPFSLEYTRDSSITFTPLDNCKWDWTINKDRGNTYKQVTTDTVILIVEDPLCTTADTAKAIVRVGKDPHISTNIASEFQVYIPNNFIAESPLIDTIDYIKWNIANDSLYEKSFAYRFYTDTVIFDPLGEATHIFDHNLPGDSATVRLIAGYNGCYDTVPEVTIPIVGPFIQIDSILKESCLNPKGLNITYQLFDAGKAHFVLTNVKTKEIFDTIVDFGVDTTLTETLSLQLPAGFYDIQYGSYNYANGKEYLMYLTYWDIQYMVAYKKNKIIAVSGVVEANFSDTVDKACWNDLIPYDYSASKNGVVFEWFKIQDGKKERLPIMYPFYAPFEDTLICEAEPDRCTDLSRAYSAFANCNLAYSTIDTSKANVVFCENGLFDVQLVVTAVNGCTDTANIANTIRLYKPEAQLKVSNATSCDSDTIQFWMSDIATDTTIISYHINYGNAGDNEFFNDSLASVDYAYKKGYYLPKLTVTDTMLCASSEIISLDVTKPDANISAPSYVCRESLFRLSSDNVHDKYNWIFGDGKSNLNANHKVNHSYDTGGDYKVHLTVYNEHGCKDTISTIIHALNEPVINIGIADSVADCPIYILEMSDEGNNVQINYREWILTNNTIDEPVFPVLSSSPLAILPLIYPGNYSLSYSINSMVCETQYADFDNFFNLGGPYLKMMELDDYYCQQDTILLTPDSSSMINSPVFVKWSFEQEGGLVNQFSDVETKTSLTDSGKYTTYLYYTDSMFCDQYDSVSFDVSHFSSDFETGNNICEVPTAITIKIKPNDLLEDYYWLFNSDTIIDTIINKDLTDTITKFNIYPVELVSKGTDGCKYAVNKEIKAYVPPTAIIFNNDTIICEDDEVQMRTYGEKNYLYKWTPSNDMDYDSIQNPIISPMDDTQYFLNIQDDSTGCTDSDTITIMVQDIPESELFYSFDTLNWIDFTPPLEVPYSDTLDLMVETNQANVTYSWTITNAYYECQSDSIVNNNCSRIGIAIEEGNEFYLLVKDSLGCYSQSFDINLETTTAQILLPTSFSPNGDGVNDNIGVNGPGINEIIEFKVFDNMGALIFETNNITDTWDGTYKGKNVATGRYFYHVKAIVTGTNEIIEQQGSVKLIR